MYSENLSEKIIENAGGKITVESKIGRGLSSGYILNSNGYLSLISKWVLITLLSFYP